MQKSFLERVFPKTKQPLLPQYDESAAFYHDNGSDSKPGPAYDQIRLSETVSRTSLSRSSHRSDDSRSGSNKQVQLEVAPLNTSIVHYNDPFLAVDRAAAVLQKTIQSLLDVQSQALSGRHQADLDAATSERSASPTLSRTGLSTTASRRDTSAGAVPVRQPKQKKVTLKAARRGLIKAMQEFTALKGEELKVTRNEARHRRQALTRVEDLESKRVAVQSEIRNLRENADGNEANSLRSEARSVELEIHELEGRLMELKARHRQLVDRATQVENTAASELSSYEGTLKLVDREAMSFLQRPPVKQSLKPRTISQSNLGQDMYALRPERRTLQLAKDQWTSEVDLLETHRIDTERERSALLEGATMWKEIVDRIDAFEQDLRAKMKTRSSESTKQIVSSMDDTALFLDQKLSLAHSKDWTLLICAISAELEAFRQARAILLPDDSPFDSDNAALPLENGNDLSGGRDTPADEDDDIPHADLLGTNLPEDSNPLQSLGPQSQADTHEDASASNESLMATLRDFQSSATPSSMLHNRTPSSSMTKSKSGKWSRQHSESEDDDPGPDFLISH